MTDLEIHQFICRGDNFCVLLHDPDHGVTAAIDAPDAQTIRAELDAKGWQLTDLFITHHHHDHTGGNLALKQHTGCRIIGAAADRGRIPGLDKALREGDVVRFGGHDVKVLETPGHTRGHLSYWLPQAGLAFTGDTLFSLGCGRLFEGTANDMYRSLQKLAALPGDTLIYCGHEYTLTNGEFALEIEPENTALRNRMEAVKALRRARKHTLPVPLGNELACNPFLRTDDANIRAALGMSKADPVAVFAELRRRKDRY